MSSFESADYRSARADLLSRPLEGSRAERRRALTALTDDWLRAVFRASGAPARGWALVAVGGYGRAELSPGSDLDLLLLTAQDVSERDAESSEIVDRLWYPVWDSGVKVDHSVRSVATARRMATRDLRVMLGLLDMRLIDGNSVVLDGLKGSVLGDWRSLARTRLSDVKSLVDARRLRHGDLADLLEPDLKESYGGVRDLAVLRALAASWITDVPHEGLAEAHDRLLDVRDALHEQAIEGGRRPSDVLLLQDQNDVARRLGLANGDQLLREVSQAARTVAYACDTAWHRVARLSVQRHTRSMRRRLRRPGPERIPLAEGVVLHDGEVVLAADARPDRDPVLALRLAGVAAQAGRPVAPAAMARIAAESPPLPVPWPTSARQAFVSLLGSGPGLVPVWEAMDRAGVASSLIPEWDVIRSAPQHNPVHVYRVDRHLLETAAAASAYVRSVDRPDLLLVGSLLHDIGKGRGRDHTEAGVEIVAELAPRLGFDDQDSRVLVDMVRLHLLLPETATRRDLDDPATLGHVADQVRDRRLLRLLHALTQADAQATGPLAWSEWKAALVQQLVDKVAAHISGEEVQPAPRLADRLSALVAATGLVVQVNDAPAADGSSTSVVVAVEDRPGLLATVAGVLALHRLEVRQADTETVRAGDVDRAVMEWRVQPLFGDMPATQILREDIRRALNGELDVEPRLRERGRHGRPGWAVPASVEFIEGASAQADVLEVKAHDEPGLLHRICTALSAAGGLVYAARVSTLGSEAINAFYVRRPDGQRLGSGEASLLVEAVHRSLTDTS